MIKLYRPKKTPTFRKVAMGTWKTAKDPSVYGELELDVTNCLALLEEHNNKSDVKLTLTHLVGKATAHCLKKRPEANGLIRGSKIYLRKDVSLFFQVHIPGHGTDRIGDSELSGTVIHGAQDLTLQEIAQGLNRQSKQIKDGQDKVFEKNLKLIRLMPWFLVRHFLDLTSFLIYGLNLNLSWLGLPQDPFGSVMITSVGGMGIEKAWAPLCAYTRVPLLIAIGAVQEKPVVRNGEVVIRSMMPLCVTFDHRFMDGIHASQMAADFKKCFAQPQEFLFA